jgi:hypothetical protein
VAQRQASVKEIRSGGAVRNAEHLANFAVTEPLDVVQHYDRSLAVGKGRQASGEPSTQVRRFGWVAELSREIVRQSVGLAHTAASGQVECRVGDYAVEPGAEWLSEQEPVEGAVGVQEAFLNGVFGILVVGGNCSGHGIRAPLVSAHQRAKGLSVATLRSGYQLPLVGQSVPVPANGCS